MLAADCQEGMKGNLYVQFSRKNYQFGLKTYQLSCIMNRGMVYRYNLFYPNNITVLFLKTYLFARYKGSGDCGSSVVKVLCYKSGVSGSIPGGVIGIFHRYKILSDRTMTLGSTQSLTEMNTRSISWG